eukprot:1136866-Pelagomonas_calceolata.AAC.1
MPPLMEPLGQTVPGAFTDAGTSSISLLVSSLAGLATFRKIECQLGIAKVHRGYNYSIGPAAQLTLRKHVRQGPLRVQLPLSSWASCTTLLTLRKCECQASSRVSLLKPAAQLHSH